MEKLRQGPEKEESSKPRSSYRYATTAIVLGHENRAEAPQLSSMLRPERAPYSLEIMDDICRVTPPELWHRDIDLLVVLLDVNLDVFMQLQLPLERGVQRVFVKDAAVKHALAGKLWG